MSTDDRFLAPLAREAARRARARAEELRVGGDPSDAERMEQIAADALALAESFGRP